LALKKKWQLDMIRKASLEADISQDFGALSATWRVFCAINLLPRLRERVQAHIVHLRDSVPNARASWNRDEKLHLTLKFLGDIPIERVPALSLAAERAVSGMKPFTLAAQDCGAFPTSRQPRVLWIGIEDTTKELARLQQQLEEECEAEGFAREQRPFRPHLTIARLRNAQAAHQLVAAHKELGFTREEFNVNELVVTRSELSSSGSRYTQISRHRLL
jgi:2'-5' RNA ligase